MKVQDFAYRVAERTMEVLEQEQHYKISEEARKNVMRTIQADLNKLLKAAG